MLLSILKKEKLELTNQEFNEWQADQRVALEGLMHNHTYLGSEQEEFSTLHPYSYKNKVKKFMNNQQGTHMLESNQTKQHKSRDEVLLLENNIHLSLDQIVNSNGDEFNDIIAQCDFNNEQLQVIKDVRRRGKNKVAAQICRKRKIDSIGTLKEEVDHLKQVKSMLQNEYNAINKKIKEMTLKFDNLYKESVSSGLGDPTDPILKIINNLKVQMDSKIENQNSIIFINNNNNKTNKRLKYSAGSETSDSQYNTNEDDSNLTSSFDDSSSVELSSQSESETSYEFDLAKKKKSFRGKEKF